MFYFRINKLKIVDDRENPPVLGIFGRSAAEVRLLSLVNTDVEYGGVDGLLDADASTRAAAIQAVVDRAVSAVQFVPIHYVRDGHQMTFGDTGRVLYRSDRVPEDFNWSFYAVESDAQVQSAGAMLQRVLHHEDFGRVTDAVGRLAAVGGAPAFAAANLVGRFVANVIADAMMSERDDLIGVVHMSLNRREHYRYGERKRDDVPDLTNNMFVDYSIFATDG